jgi:hypothetical protein
MLKKAIQAGADAFLTTGYHQFYEAENTLADIDILSEALQMYC